jgi:hypothetical protein
VIDGFRLVENSPPDSHKCPVPLKDHPQYPDQKSMKIPDGQLGDVWQCANCMQCWHLCNINQYQYNYSPIYRKWLKISSRKAQRLIRKAARHTLLSKTKSKHMLSFNKSTVDFLLILIPSMLLALLILYMAWTS